LQAPDPSHVVYDVSVKPLQLAAAQAVPPAA
jgi:hypothetical protein